MLDTIAHVVRTCVKGGFWHGDAVFNTAKKEKDRFYVTWKGIARGLAGALLEPAIAKAFPDKNIIHEQISNPDLLVVSHFFCPYR